MTDPATNVTAIEADAPIPDQPQNRAVAQLPPKPVREIRVVKDTIPVLDTGRFEHMQRIAAIMADCALVPEALVKDFNERQRFANCFLIVNQASHWSMDPFALAQNCYVLKGKLGYEGKVIAAAVNADPRLEGRLNYAHSGSGDNRQITVSGTFADTRKTETIVGSVAQWKTTNDQWKKDPDQMLVYRGVRQWARRHMPDRLLGVYSVDELQDIAARERGEWEVRDITPSHEAISPPSPPPAPVSNAHPPSPDLILQMLDVDLTAVTDKDGLDDVWVRFDGASDLPKSDREKAEALYEHHEKRLAQ